MEPNKRYEKIKQYIDRSKNSMLFKPVFFLTLLNLNDLRRADRLIFGIQSINLFNDGVHVRALGADELELFNQSFIQVRNNDLRWVGDLTILVRNERKFVPIEGLSWGGRSQLDPNPTEWDSGTIAFRHRDAYGTVFTNSHQIVPETSITRQLKIDALTNSESV